MARRYLFGPVTSEYARQNLHAARAAGQCVPFDATGQTGLAIGPQDTWEEICSGALTVTLWKNDGDKGT